VFEAAGRLRAASAALVGMARGDESAPGVGQIAPALIPVAMRTTPAGRFNTEPGRNLDGEDIVWFDYDAGLAIHRLRPNARQARQERIRSHKPEDHRVSAGCVVVPVEFYEQAIAPVLGHQPGVVYVLPDTRSIEDVFNVPSASL
jgi:hypothetical protein